jgi:hypothetical protein
MPRPVFYRIDTPLRFPIYRHADNELVGFVIAVSTHWRALTLFGGILATFDTRQAATQHVLARGLASLAAHWQYYDCTAAAWHTCLIQEANESTVTIVIGFEAVPGAPTKRLSADDFVRGDILTLE